MTFQPIRLAFAALLLAGSAAQAAERTFSVRNFDAVELSGPHEVVVTTGRPAAVRAEDPQAAIDSLRFSVDGARSKSTIVVSAPTATPCRCGSS